MIAYFDNNWKGIEEQWVQFHITKRKIFENRTNNRLESLNQKLEAVIAKYSKFSTFVSLLLDVTSSVSIESDIRVAESVMKVPVETSKHEVHDKQYINLLTRFAFQKYHKESTKRQNIQFEHNDGIMAISGDQRNRIITRDTVCECSFYTTMILPCRHILAFRETNAMNLFDPLICDNRWRKSKMDALGQLDYVLDDEPIVEVAQIASQSNVQRSHTFNQKFRMSKTKCDELCTYMAELDEGEFKAEYETLCDFIEHVQGHVNQLDKNAGNASGKNACETYLLI